MQFFVIVYFSIIRDIYLITSYICSLIFTQSHSLVRGRNLCSWLHFTSPTMCLASNNSSVYSSVCLSRLAKKYQFHRNDSRGGQPLLCSWIFCVLNIEYIDRPLKLNATGRLFLALLSIILHFKAFLTSTLNFYSESFQVLKCDDFNESFSFSSSFLWCCLLRYTRWL